MKSSRLLLVCWSMIECVKPVKDSQAATPSTSVGLSGIRRHRQLLGHHAQFRLGYTEPTAAFRSVVHLYALASRLAIASID